MLLRLYAVFCQLSFVINVQPKRFLWLRTASLLIEHPSNMFNFMYCRFRNSNHSKISQPAYFLTELTSGGCSTHIQEVSSSIQSFDDRHLSCSIWTVARKVKNGRGFFAAPHLAVQTWLDRLANVLEKITWWIPTRVSTTKFGMGGG